MLIENLISIALSLTLTFGSLLEGFEESYMQFGVSEGLTESSKVRRIVEDVLIYRSMPVKESRELFFQAVHCQDSQVKSLLELLFHQNEVINTKYSDNYSIEDHFLGGFRRFAENGDNRLIAEGIIQRIVVENHPFLAYSGFKFQIEEFLLFETVLSSFLKHKIVQEFARMLREVSQVQNRSEGRIWLKSLLYWTLTVYPIEDIEDAFNYAFISLIPLENLQNVVEAEFTDLKSLMNHIIDCNTYQMYIKEKARAASYRMFNEIRPERLVSYNLFVMDSDFEISRGNMGFLYKWKFEEFQAELKKLEDEDLTIQVTFLLQDSVISRFYGHYICQNYRPIKADDPKILWRSLFYSAMRDIQSECPAMAERIKTELDYNEETINVTEGFEAIDRISALGHWSTLKLILKKTPGVHRDLLKSLLIEAIKTGQEKIVKFLSVNELIGPWSKAVQIAAHVDYPEIFWFLLATWPSVIERSITSGNVFMYPGFYERKLTNYVFQSLKNAESCFHLALEYGKTGYGHFIKQICEGSDAKVTESLFFDALKRGNMRMAGHILFFANISKENMKNMIVRAIETGQKDLIEVFLTQRPDVLISVDPKRRISRISDDLGTALEVIAYTGNFVPFEAIKDRFMQYIRTCKGFENLLRAFKIASRRGNKRMVEMLLEERPVLCLVFARALA